MEGQAQQQDRKYPAHPGPRQTVAAERRGGQEARLNALPFCPLLQSEGQVSRARLEDPPTSPAKYWDRRGKEELCKPEGLLAWRPEERVAEDRAATAQKRSQGRSSGAQTGLFGENK